MGLVWSPLIPSERRGQIMDGLMDISDWLPTLYEAAGGTVSDLKPMDGTSQWNSFLYGVPSRRSHILHNIDDQLGYAAIRHGDFKLVKGNFDSCSIFFRLGITEDVCRNDLWRILGRLVWPFRSGRQIQAGNIEERAG